MSNSNSAVPVSIKVFAVRGIRSRGSDTPQVCGYVGAYIHADAESVTTEDSLTHQDRGHSRADHPAAGKRVSYGLRAFMREAAPTFNVCESAEVLAAQLAATAEAAKVAALEGAARAMVPGLLPGVAVSYTVKSADGSVIHPFVKGGLYFPPADPTADDIRKDWTAVNGLALDMARRTLGLK